jgi:glycosyltransferase involved in cell wall biosynthesis
LSEPSIEIIIPAYNEADNLVKLIEILSTIRSIQKFDVIIVDNGSTDKSEIILDEYSKKYYWLSICSINKNKGYGYGISKGLMQTKADIIGWTHADLQFNPKTLIEAIELSKKNKDAIVKGKRTKRKITATITTFGMSLIAMFLLKIPLYDINAQPKLFPRKYYEENFKDIAPNDFSFDLFFIFSAVKRNIDIVEFEVEFSPRQAGEAKGGGASLQTVLKIIIRTVSYMWKIRNDNIPT